MGEERRRQKKQEESVQKQKKEVWRERTEGKDVRVQERKGGSKRRCRKDL